MIQLNELRIGNWVYLSKTSKFPMQVVSLGTDYVYLDFEGNEGDVWEPCIKEMCGVPLTEELLLKLGFEEIESCNDDSHEDYHRWLERDYPGLGCVYHSDTKGYLIAEINEEELHIESLHQLQNLYYTLTAKELEIKI